MTHAQDIKHMRHALRLAARGLGRTWPNPSVGALVVKDGAVIARAATARGGRPHAETQALAQAGGKARGATLYVTLEPCAHFGATPPCAEAVIAAGITRVVAACADPNPLVSGKGLAMLRAANIEVEEGVCEAEARALNEGFFSVMERKRPFVTLKTATSLDGKIASADGESKWITGEQSRRMVHALRACHDAIITGIGTVLRDDPQLTCRLPGREADSPQRVVMDADLRIPEDAKLLPAWIFTSAQAPKKESEKAARLRKKGALLLSVTRGKEGLSLKEALATLAGRGVTRLMVEAGGALAGAFLREGLVDRLYWFRAPVVLGDGAMPAFKACGNQPLALAPRFRLVQTERLSEDTMETYELQSLIPNP